MALIGPPPLNEFSLTPLVEILVDLRTCCPLAVLFGTAFPAALPSLALPNPPPLPADLIAALPDTLVPEEPPETLDYLSYY
jgi:hypothetical protein